MQRNFRKLEMLETALSEENYLKTDIRLRQLRLEDLQNSRLFQQLDDLYNDLGGSDPKLPNDLNYHLQYKDLLLQYDDALHFNRYRSMSLQLPFYQGLKGFNLIQYRTYCRQMEFECLKGGLSKDEWHSREGEMHFGPSEDPGDLSKDRSGSAGWKLRAWRDTLQDFAGICYGFKVLRVSAYDKIMVNGKLTTIEALISSQSTQQLQYVAKSLVRRIINLKGS